MVAWRAARLEASGFARAGEEHRGRPAPPSTAGAGVSTTAPAPDQDSAAWLTALRAEDRVRDEAISRLRGLLLSAARHEAARRRAAVPHLRGTDLDDLAHQSANDALVAVLAKLDEYRGDSRFTTWAYKFALLEAGVKLRRRAWQGREVPLEPQRWPPLRRGGIEMSRHAQPPALRRLLGPAGPEVSCEQCFHELDRYVEAELAGRAADLLVPGMAAHLEGCPACDGDHDSLLELLRNEAREGAAG